MYEFMGRVDDARNAEPVGQLGNAHVEYCDFDDVEDDGKISRSASVPDGVKPICIGLLEREVDGDVEGVEERLVDEDISEDMLLGTLYGLVLKSARVPDSRS